jgi:hypothetical protein
MKTKLKREPHKAEPRLCAKEAWWYEDGKSILVYIAPDSPLANGGAISCRIQRRHLLDWIERTKSTRQEQS